MLTLALDPDAIRRKSERPRETKIKNTLEKFQETNEQLEKTKQARKEKNAAARNIPDSTPDNPLAPMSKPLRRSGRGKQVCHLFHHMITQANYIYVYRRLRSTILRKITRLHLPWYFLTQNRNCTWQSLDHALVFQDCLIRVSIFLCSLKLVDSLTAIAPSATEAPQTLGGIANAHQANQRLRLAIKPKLLLQSQADLVVPPDVIKPHVDSKPTELVGAENSSSDEDSSNEDLSSSNDESECKQDEPESAQDLRKHRLINHLDSFIHAFK